MGDFKNTPKKGSFRHLVFRDGDTWYAVALEFNIVESAEDSKLALFNLLQAVDGYIAAVKKIKGARNFSALNQTPDPEYQKIWDSVTKNETKAWPVKSPYQVAMYGVTTV